MSLNHHYRVAAVIAALTDDPSQSDGMIARDVGLHASVVRRTRAALVAEGRIPDVRVRVGADGKVRGGRP